MPYTYNPLPFKFDKTSTVAGGGGVTQITADDATVVTPTAGNINIAASDTNANDDNGIRSIGAGSTVTLQLTNRNTASTTTTDDVATTILSVPLAAGDGVYLARGSLEAYNTTDQDGAAYVYEGAAKSVGGVATEIAIEQKSIFEEAGMSASDFSIAVSGNNLEITVTGIAGKTINWGVLFEYRYRS